MLSYVAKHSKQRKTTKVIKLQWIASIWCQKHQTNAKLQKWSYFDEFQSIWRQNYQNIWVRSQNYKSNQITMDCIDLTSKRSKLLSYVPKLQSNRITINCIDLMPKRSRMLSYVAKHSKQRKTTKVIKLQWIASIWRQNDHNNAKLRKWSNYNALHRFDVKTIKNVEVRRKTFKTTQNYKMKSNYNEFASIWCQNDQKCWVTSQNYKCDHITMNLHRFDVKTIKTTKVHRFDVKTIKTTQNYKRKWSNLKITTNDHITMNCIDLTSKRSRMLSYVAKHSKQRKLQNDQITMNCIDLTSKRSQQRKTTKVIKLQCNCIDLTSKRSKMLSYVAKHSKQRKTTKVIKLQWIASIWCQNNQTTQNYKSDQIIMQLQRFDAKRSKSWVTS